MQASGSALYVGTVTHHRFGAPAHTFRHPTYMHLVDLDEIDDLDRRMRLFGRNRRWRPVVFRDADHLGEPGRRVAQNLRAWLAGEGVEWPGGRVLLLTHCRVFGHVFNPVSFYYCLDPQGGLQVIVAEVNNTFGERHAYLLRAGEQADADGDPGALAAGGVAPAATGAGGRHVWRTKKVFHVSPFFSLDGTYRFEMDLPSDRVRARIDLTVQGRTVFTATLALERRPLDDRTLAWLLFRYPLVTLRVLAAIHWEALRLWRKGAPYRPKPPYDPEAARGGLA